MEELNETDVGKERIPLLSTTVGETALTLTEPEWLEPPDQPGPHTGLNERFSR